MDRTLPDPPTFLQRANRLNTWIGQLEFKPFRKTMNVAEWGNIFHEMMQLKGQADRLGVNVSSWRKIIAIAGELQLSDPKILEIPDELWKQAAEANARLIHQLSGDRIFPSTRIPSTPKNPKRKKSAAAKKTRAMIHLKPLRGTAKKIADYITKSPGKLGAVIAEDCDTSYGNFRRIFSKKLRPLGFYNERDGEGYYPPM
jgi:hypothetical protein